MTDEQALEQSPAYVTSEPIRPNYEVTPELKDEFLRELGAITLAESEAELRRQSANKQVRNVVNFIFRHNVWMRAHASRDYAAAELERFGRMKIEVQGVIKGWLPEKWYDRMYNRAAPLPEPIEISSEV